MTKTKIWVGLVLGCWLSLPLLSLAANADDQDNSPSEDEIPDAELLEFLANYGDTDDETFDLIIYHGKEDLDETDEPSTPLINNNEGAKR
jgi:hypothetical protein